MKQRPSKISRSVVLTLLGGLFVVAVFAVWQAGLFQPRVQRLVRRLQTAQEAEDRYAAARQLGEMGDRARPAVPALVGALQDDGRYVTATMLIFPREHYVRNAAYGALRQIRGPETVDALVAVIAQCGTSGEGRGSSGNEQHEAEAYPRAGQSGGEVHSATGRGKPDTYTCGMAARLLAELGPEARPAAERLLEAIDGCRQGQVVQLSLGALEAMQLEQGSPAAEKARQVLPQFCNWSGDTGRMAARLLYRLWPEDGEVLGHFVQALLAGRSPSPPGSIPINQHTVPLLVDHLADGTRETAMAHLAAADAEHVVPALRQALQRPEWLVRAGAASVLAQHGVTASAAEAELARLLEDENQTVRLAAARALWQCAHRVEDPLPILVAALDSEDARIRQSARTFVNERGGEDVWAAGTLLEHATSDHPKPQRLLALEILARIGRPAAELAPRLLELLRDPDPDIQRAAAKAVAAVDKA